VAVVRYARRAADDLLRVANFLTENDPRAAGEALDLIEGAVRILAQHPLIGRAVEEGRRELVISRGRSGYVALYRYDTEEDRVFILALRHQREAGF
jgi:plasmid stabilization system protein ParE